MIDDFGSEQLVFSTDYPHGDSRYPAAVESFIKLRLAEEHKRKILWDNCARLYAVSDLPGRKSDNTRRTYNHAEQGRKRA